MTAPEMMIPAKGANLVEASAGTGKTTWMVRTAVRLLLQDQGMPHVRPEGLLAVTFTRAATAELKERIRDALHRVHRIGEGFEPAPGDEWMQEMLNAGGGEMSARLGATLGALDRLSVTTIHGFCKGVLEEFALECSVPIGLRFIEQDQRYRDDAVADEWRTLTWQDDHLSRFVMGLRTSRDAKRWAPNALAQAARAVRQGIGAKRPDRIDREQVLAELRAPLAGLLPSWNEQRIRDFWVGIKWNKDGVTHEELESLCVAMRALQDGKEPIVPHIARWSKSAVRETSNATRRENSALIDAEPFLAACEPVADASMRAANLLWQDAVLSVADRMERAMELDRVAGFDEMIGYLQRAIADANTGKRLRDALAERYDAVLVDEFQDTDWAQWNIFSTTFEMRPLVLVGDPKQSIYGFRGADITAYQDARRIAERAGDDRVSSLTTNYRSDRDLVSATEIIFRQTETPFDVDANVLDFERVNAARGETSLSDPVSARRPMVIVDLGEDLAPEQERKVTRFVADEVARLLRDPDVSYVEKPGEDPRPLRQSDIAILVSANRHAEPLLEALRAHRIAAVSGNTGDITDATTWQDVVAVLAAIDDPSDARVVRLALATSLGGWSARQLMELDQDGARWREVIERLGEARRDWTSYGVLTALTRLARDWDSRATLARYPDGERRLTDFRHVLSLLQDAEREGHRNPAMLRSWATRFAAAIDRDAEYRQQQLESDDDAVTISTMHAAKGLEWPVVFCCYLWKAPVERSTVPRIARFADGAREITFRDESLDGELAGDTPLSEALRLAYVALTRARSRTYVVWTKNKREKAGAIHHLLKPLGGNAPETLAKQHADLIAIVSEEEARSVPVPRERDADAVNVEMTARTLDLPAEQLKSWTVSSYTRFTKGLEKNTDAFEPGMVDESEASVDGTTENDQLPAGARTGLALHELLERLDFANVADNAALGRAIDNMLTSYNLPRTGADPSRRAAAADVVRRMMTATLSTPIPGTTTPLASIPMDRTLREWRFNLAMEQINLAAMSEVFGDHGAGWIAKSYAQMLATSTQQKIDGFLTGVVDLVAEVDGRWWIVDWKSNMLGPRASSYGDDSCRREMMRAHYVLQYHIYVVALHRFLRGRLGQHYDYERDFGGVGYAFLRGLALGAPAWFVDRPSHALVEALDACIGGYRNDVG